MESVVGLETRDGTIAVSRAELILALQHDCVIFLSFYLQEELTLEVPQLHIDVWDTFLTLVQQANELSVKTIAFELRKLLAIPREHAKSTLAKLAAILILKYSPLSFLLYVSKTNSIAKNACRDIMMWLYSRQEQDLFGQMPPAIKSSETESLWILDIRVQLLPSQPVFTKRIIIKALGADQQVRGLLVMNRRPQLMIIDDIEDLDNTANESNQKALDEWFMGSLLKSKDSLRCIIIFIGNMIRDTTLLARLSKDPEWNPTVFGCLVRDQHGNLRALWEGKHTVESLLADYRRYRQLGTGHVWEAEMMNLTRDEIIKTDMKGLMRIPLPNPDQLECGGLTIDPAFGKNAWNDDSAIAVHARVRNLGIPAVIETRHGKFREEEIFDEAWSLSLKWGIRTWFIESDAAQKLLIPFFTLLMANRQINTAAIQMIPVTSGKSSKASRINGWRSAVGDSSYAIAETEEVLIDRISEYTPESSDHDDLCDAAAYGTVIWAQHGVTIESNGISSPAMMLRSVATDDDSDYDKDPALRSPF